MADRSLGAGGRDTYHEEGPVRIENAENQQGAGVQIFGWIIFRLVVKER